MAQVDIGKIKIVWKNAWNSGTAYTVDDAVSHSGNSYICIQAGTGQNPSTATAYWEPMAQGADLISISGTAQGDIYYNNGSAIARLAPGTANQALITGGAGANPSWGTISSGTYSVHAIDSYNYNTTVSTSSRLDYVDIAGGNTVSFTPTSTDDWIFFTWGNACYQNAANLGMDSYINFGTSSTLGSGDTKLAYGGQHNWYFSGGNCHMAIYKSLVYPCTGLTVGTTYYAEQAGGSHTQSNPVEWNYNNSGNNSTYDRHYVQLIHYKKN